MGLDGSDDHGIMTCLVQFGLARFSLNPPANTIRGNYAEGTFHLTYNPSESPIFTIKDADNFALDLHQDDPIRQESSKVPQCMKILENGPTR